ncbi:hypothetical protein K431DRAFT_48099 [Polychaeton citri CBS 116435]|uniref:LIM zinc-binding domain-containing protein n=1 Tax=Polychaeton citri CBS 116435 TaxID=1314669 RepID=A0A9P4UUE5_9PEZI|nr:hypothetical protein K431DRAFT_48099 [Polychaeton citri CBS 116435]
MSLAAALQADGARPASFLPSVKCSSCGDEIEIVSMASHICGKQQQSPKSHAAHMSNPFTLRQANAQPSQHQPTAPSPLGQTTGSSQQQQSRGRAPTLNANQQTFSPKPMRPPPPKINAEAANQPFLGPRPSRSESPVSPALSSRSGVSQGKPYMPPFARGAVSPGPRLWDPRPPSPEISSNLDCAFPPFPMTGTRSASSSNSTSRPGTSHGRKTPTIGERAPSRGSNRRPSRLDDREPFNLEPRSPGMVGGENVLKKMDTLTSGPFDGKRRKPSQPEILKIDDLLAQRDTAEEKTKMLDEMPPRPATSASTHSTHSRGASEKKVPPVRPLRPDEHEALSPTFLDHFSSEPVPDPLSQFSPTRAPAQAGGEDRSNTYPIQQRNESGSRERRPSEPAIYSNRERRPTITKMPTAPPNLYPPRSESRNGTRMDFRLHGAPPVPKPVEQHRQESSHSPSESASSTMSSVGQSAGSIGPSPASSAASSVDAFSPLSRDSSGYGEEKILPLIPVALKPSQKPGERAAEKPTSPPRNFARPNPARQEPPVLDQPLPKPNLQLARPMDSPTDPTIPDRDQTMQRQRRPSEPSLNDQSAGRPAHPGILRTQTAPMSPTNDRTFGLSPAMHFSPDEYDPYKQPAQSIQPRPRSKSSASQASGATSPQKMVRPPVPIITTPTPPPIPKSAPRGLYPRRKGTVSKPPCRGCGKIIEGKSVKAADGRLTGRWHKACFTCRSCHEPFATADFYVIENHPYCEQHYHENNGSLCHGCHRGIEGQYLETSGSATAAGYERKYHPRCFTCHDCREILSDDYFEIMGKVYCERHALAAMRGQTRVAGTPAGPLSSLNPAMNGQLRAERRTTRLMMM